MILSPTQNSIIQYLINRAPDYYAVGAGVRKYHGIDHMYNVVSAIRKLTATPSDELILAAVWHDAVYFPGAGNDANERCSAAALNMEFATFCQTGGVQFEIVAKARQMIQLTAIKDHLTHHELAGDHATLLDADLSSLAGEYREFVKNQVNILDENSIDWQTGKELSANFLSQFLTCRKHIYHTAKARELWEESARKNIEWFIADYGQNG